MPRVTLQALQRAGGGVQPASRPIDPYSAINIGDPGVDPIVDDLAALAPALLRYTQDREAEKARAEAASARDVVARLGTDQLMDVGAAPNMSQEEISRELLRRIESDDPTERIPSEGSPVFQIALQKAAAEDLGREARRRLLGRVQEFTVLRDGENLPVQPPNPEAVIDEVFAPFESNFLASSEFGRDAFAKSRLRTENEFKDAVLAAREEALAKQANELAIRDFTEGQGDLRGLRDLELVDPEEIPGVLHDVGFTLTDLREGRHLSAERSKGLLLQAIRLRANAIAADDPDAALRFVEDASQTPIGDTGATISQDVLFRDELVHVKTALRKQSEDKTKRNVENSNALTSITTQFTRNAALANLSDPDLTNPETLEQRAQIVIGQMLENPELKKFAVELSDGIDLTEEMQDAIIGEVNKQLAIAKRQILAAGTGGGMADVETLFAENLPPDEIYDIATAFARAETITQAQLNDIAHRLDETRASEEFRRNSSDYDLLVTERLAIPRSVGSNSAEAVQSELAQLRIETLSGITQLLDSVVQENSSPRERRAQGTETLRGPEVTAAVDAFRSRLRTAQEETNAALSKIHGSISGWRFDDARSTVADARGTSISIEQATALEAQIVTKESEMIRELAFSREVTDVRRSLVGRLQALLVAQETPNVDITNQVDAAERALMSESRRLGLEFNQAGIPPGQRGQAISEALLAITDQVLKDATVTEGLPAVPEAPDPQDQAAFRRLVEQLQAADDVLGRAPTSSFAQEYGVESVDPNVMELSDHLRDGNLGTLFTSRQGQVDIMRRGHVKELLSIDLSKHSEAGTALAGQWVMPAAEVLAGRSSMEAVLDRTDVRGLDLFISTVWQEGRLSDEELARVSSELQERGAVSVERTQANKVFVRLEFDVRDQNLNPFLTEFTGFELLPPDQQKAFLDRVGFSVGTQENLTRSLEDFADAQRRIRKLNAQL